jgi:phosphatidylglycerol phospholipase C
VVNSDVITAQPNWETELAPRIILGLWHPKFIVPAKKYLPSIQLSHIGMSTRVAREFFWESCDAFSLSFPSLLSAGGEKFRRECKAAGKKIMVWTVNRREEMIEVRIYFLARSS